MIERGLADAVVVLHAAFVLFVALGGVLAWRWRHVLPVHVAAVAWGVGIVLVGFDCPLTSIERALRERGGETVSDVGFVDRYVEGVVYPEAYTPLLRAVAAVLIAASWAAPARRWVSRRPPGRWPRRRPGSLPG